MFSLSFRQLIYNYPEQLFADTGMMAIEHADFEGMERLALVLGESDNRVNTTAVGVCDKILCRASVILCTCVDGISQ